MRGRGESALYGHGISIAQPTPALPPDVIPYPAYLAVGL
jgi:hypothetical protein